MNEVSEDTLQEIARGGFFVFPEFLESATTLGVIEALESLQSDTLASRVRRGIAFARRNILSVDVVRALTSQALIRRLLDRVAPDLIAVRAILFDKSGAANWTVPWHQDRSIAVRERLEVPGFGPWSTKASVIHVQPPAAILQRMITLRFHLDPCGSDNGPLRVICGTHDHILSPREIVRCVAEGEQTLCTTGAGGLVVMRPLLLHASSPAARPARRRVLHVEFGPSTLPGNLSWAMA